jgi:hypothetical protein
MTQTLLGSQTDEKEEEEPLPHNLDICLLNILYENPSHNIFYAAFTGKGTTKKAYCID